MDEAITAPKMTINIAGISPILEGTNGRARTPEPIAVANKAKIDPLNEPDSNGENNLDFKLLYCFGIDLLDS